MKFDKIVSKSDDCKMYASSSCKFENLSTHIAWCFIFKSQREKWHQIVVDSIRSDFELIENASVSSLNDEGIEFILNLCLERFDNARGKFETEQRVIKSELKKWLK